MIIASLQLPFCLEPPSIKPRYTHYLYKLSSLPNQISKSLADTSRPKTLMSDRWSFRGGTPLLSQRQVRGTHFERGIDHCDEVDTDLNRDLWRQDNKMGPASQTPIGPDEGDRGNKIEVLIYDVFALCFNKCFQYIHLVLNCGYHRFQDVRKSLLDRSGGHQIEDKEIGSERLSGNEKGDLIEADFLPGKFEAPSIQSSDDSVVIVDVKKHSDNNLYALFFERDEEREPKGSFASGNHQYGTSLSIAKFGQRGGWNLSRTSTPLSQSVIYSDNTRSSRGPNILDSIPTNDYDKYVSKYYFPLKPISKDKYSLVGPLIDNLSLEDKEGIIKEREQRQLQIAKEKEELKTQLRSLTKDQLALVDQYWKKPPSSLVVVSGFLIEITTRDLQTLRDGCWLNDNVIDFYFNLITLENPSVYGWTTHFYTTLKQKGYPGVARWAKRRKIDVTSKDIILVPINIMSTHWALAAINNKDRTFKYYDSLSSRGNLPALKLLQLYMKEEGTKQNSSIDFDSYSLVASTPTPQQQNGYDCGVFTCICAHYVSKNRPLKYGQKDMKLIRRRMAYEIIMKKLFS